MDNEYYVQLFFNFQIESILFAQLSDTIFYLFFKNQFTALILLIIIIFNRNESYTILKNIFIVVV